MTPKLMLAVATLVVAPSAFAQEAEKPVAVNTVGLPDHLKARIEEKAQEGPTALIRYINNTRHIHNLRVEMIVLPEGTAPAQSVSKESEKVAERPAR
jgi:hypothetical protein